MNYADQPLSSDLMNALSAIEAEFPVLDWSCDGINVWPLLRIRWIYAEWARHYSGQSEPKQAHLPLQRLRAFLLGPVFALGATYKRLRYHDRGASQRDILFLSDGVSFAKIGMSWVDRYCDPILSGASDVGLTSAMLTLGRAHHHPRNTPSIEVQPAMDRANTYGMLCSMVAPVRAHLPEHAGVLRRLREAGFGTESMSTRKIQSDTLRLKLMSRYYEGQLRRIRPRLAFIVGYYGLEGMSFILACRKSEIPVVDIQHGVQSEVHPAYSSWPTPPECGSHMLLPDFFWVWSDWERSVIDQWAGGTGHRAIVGGDPWNSIWSDGSQWTGISETLAAARELKERSKAKPVVVVTLQHGLAYEQQLRPLFDLLRLASDQLTFWVRLHPCMMERRDEISKFLEPGGEFELERATDIPLPALLHYADAHMTHSSSAVIEAAQFGLRTILTSSYGAELFKPFLASGVAQLETGCAKSVFAALMNLTCKKLPRNENITKVVASLEEILNQISKPGVEYE